MKRKILILFSLLILILGFCCTALAINIPELISISAWEDPTGMKFDRNDKVKSTKYWHMDDGILREGEDLDKFTSEQQAQIKADFEAARDRCGNGYITCGNHGHLWRKVINWGFDGKSRADLVAWYNRISNVPASYMGWTSITELISRLNSENPNIILGTHASVFCIKHNHPLYHKAKMEGYHITTPFTIDDYYALTWNNYDDAGSARRTSKPTTTDWFNITTDAADERNNIIENYSNVKFIASDEMNLKNLTHPFDGKNYDLAYIAAFSEKDSPSTGFDSNGIKNYTGVWDEEIGQKSIWANTGADATSFENNLYYASTAFDSYETELLTHKTSVEVKVDSNAGTVLKDSNSIYQVGPFYMSDYTYAYCKYAEDYSGLGLEVDPGLFGGIIDGYITLRDDNNNEKKLYIDGKSVKVVYSGWNSSKGSVGNNNRSGTKWSKPTSSTNAAAGVSGYIYPWPNSTFYIEIDRSLCRDSETLISMNFDYRKTESEGAGWVAKSKIIKHTWSVNQSSLEFSTCTYYCTTSECKREGISRDNRSDANGTHIRYCVTKGYCSKGTKNCSTHCGGDCGSCGHTCGAGCEGEKGCTHSCSSVSLNYCEHGYSDGDHTKTMKSWGNHGSDICSGVTRCGSESSPNNHGHTTCKAGTWDDSFIVTDAQPLVAVHHATVTITNNNYGSSYSGGTVRLTTDITIDKYIVNISHTGVAETTFDSKTSRRNKTIAEKLSNEVKLERGDEITFYVDIVNDQKEQVQYKFKDTMPDHKDCVITIKSAKITNKIWSGERFISEIPDSSWKSENFTSGSSTFEPSDTSKEFSIRGEIPGNTVKRFIVKLKADGSEAEQKNVVKLIYRNEGKTGISEDWMRTSVSRVNVSNGPVVNIAQLDTGKTEDEDYFYIKSYNVPVDKYIINVQHSTTGEDVYTRKELVYEKDYDESIGGYTEKQKYFDRDVINEKNKIFKQNSAVYLEYGDIVTYRIDLQNTYFSDEGEGIKKSDSPYYDPDGVVVDLKDTLPTLSNGTLAVDTSSIAIKYVYKDSDGNTETYQIGRGISGAVDIVDWRYTNHSASNKASKGKIRFETEYSVSGKVLTIKNLPVTEQTESYLEVSCIVDTPKFGTYENKVEITEVRNLNNFKANNTSNRTVSSEFFTLNEYKAILDNYIVGTNTISDDDIRNVYGAEILRENKSNGFENLYTYNTDLTKDGADTVTQSSASNSTTARQPSHNRAIQNEANRVSTEQDRADYSVAMEKGETIKFEIKVKNNSITKEGDFNNNGGYQYKHATRVRTTEIKEMLEDGLILRNVSAKIYKENGNLKHKVETVNFTNDGTENINGKTYNTYTLKIGNKINNSSNAEYTILEPNEWIIYTVTVEVTRSNMYLYNLENKAEIKKLTNINNNDGNDLIGFGNIFTGKYQITDLNSFDRTKQRIVTEQNTVNKNQKYSSDFIKLKDLIISGRVWLDHDKNGYMSSYDNMPVLSQGQNSNVNSDRDMQGVTVRLYTSDGKLVRTTTTDSNGLYTFAKDENGNFRSALDQRILKATKNNDTTENTINKYDTVTNYNNNSKYINYYVEFEYDGVLYKATEIYGGINEKGSISNYGKNNLSKDWTIDTTTIGLLYKTDSNAYEFKDVREAFNHNHQLITYNKSYSTSGAESTLRYTKDGHASYLNVDHNRKMTARSFISQGNNKSIDNTSLLWFFGVEVNMPETEYLKYINLGLEEREDADISLTKDVYEVKTTINGEEMTYSYNQNSGVNNGEAETGTYLQDYQVKKPYGITLYESDYKYRHSQYKNKAVQEYKGTESELNVEVTYRITVNNNKVTDNELLNDGSFKDIKLNAKVHEIVDLYDANFKKYNNSDEKVSVRQNTSDRTFASEDRKIPIAEAWCIDTSGNKVMLGLSNSSNYSSKANNFSGDGYNTVYITGMENVVIEEGASFDIFVKYVLDKETIEKYGEDANALKIVEAIESKRNTTSQGTENIAQVNAYSICYEDGKPTSIVERDSNAGNIGILDSKGTLGSADNSKYYEDNTYKTGIEIMVDNTQNPPKAGIGTATDDSSGAPQKAKREIIGKVWDDSRSEQITQGNYTQYYADGEFGNVGALEKAKQNENVPVNYDGETEEKDIVVRNAKVEYVEIIEIDGKYYEEKLIDVPWKPEQSDRTVRYVSGEDEADQRYYSLSGFIPGYYIVRFTYGDTVEGDELTKYNRADRDMQLFNGQDYKSTKYTGVSDKVENEDKIMEGMQKKNKSDAKDDEIKRLETMAYSETMVNQKAEILQGTAKGKVEALADEEENTPEQLKALTENTYMYADTITFLIKPEKLHFLTDPEDSSNKSYGDLNGSIIYKDLDELQFEHTSTKAREYTIRNLDFGIEYRPESQISLNKEVSKINLTTSDGTELVSLALKTVYRGEGNSQTHEIIEAESKGIEYTQFISNEYQYIDVEELLTSEDYQGFIFVNVDDEILQGSTVEIEYSFTAENNSEIDRININLDNLRYRQNDNIDNNLENLHGILEFKDADIEEFFRYVRLDEEIGIYNKLYTDAELSSEENKDSKLVYTASGTAKEILYNEYYDKDDNGDVYRRKELKTYDPGRKDEDQNKEIYYGRYLGRQYYLGILGDQDVISSLKFDKILDYVDTDLVYKPQSGVKEDNTLWTSTTDEELKDVFVIKENFNEQFDKLTNTKSISFVTYEKDSQGKDLFNKPITSNLLVSVDDRVKDIFNSDDKTTNKDLSRFLKPYWSIRGADGKIKEDNKTDSRGNITLTVSKVISAETSTDDMQYENIAEVIQFTSQTGRRTNYTTTIGNAIVKNGEFKEAEKETDTSATEVITLTPPTGLDRLNRVVRDTVETAGKGIGISVMLIALVVGGFLITKVVIKKIKKKPIV